MLGRKRTAVLAAAVVIGASPVLAPPALAAGGVPRPDHIVVVIEENRAQGQVIGNPQAPYINSLARGGAEMTRSFAITHPSEPNYLALFSGSTHGVHGDPCPLIVHGPSLGSELLAAGLSFADYSESLPSAGSSVCSSGYYTRLTNPALAFPDIPRSAVQPFSSFPRAFSHLPTVSFVVPNLCHSMHSCGGVPEGDRWLKANLGAYADWVGTHNSLLIATWDEDDYTPVNHIPTIFFGAGVRPGVYGERISHYNVLRTIEDAYGLPHAGASASAKSIGDIW
jgi:hypothetical protein